MVAWCALVVIEYMALGIKELASHLNSAPHAVSLELLSLLEQEVVENAVQQAAPAGER